MYKLERRAQAPVFDFTKKIQNQVLDFGVKIGNFLKNPIENTSHAVAQSIPSPSSAPAPPPPPTNMVPIGPLVPVGISGWYKVSGPNEATFYSITDWPLTPVGPGWIVDSLPGLRGRLFMTKATNSPGKDEQEYTWSFTLQSDMDQYVSDDVTYVTTSTLYPPGRISVLRSGPIYGYYEVVKHVPKFFFSAPPPSGTAAGWIIEGLPTLGPCKLLDFDQNIPERHLNAAGTGYVNVLLTLATLQPVDGSFPADSGPVYVKGFPSVIHEPSPTAEYVPGKFNKMVKPTESIQAPANIQLGNTAPMRDLGDTGLFPEPPSTYTEIKGRGFSQGSVLGLYAVGPQEEYLLNDEYTKSQWNPEFKQHSNFVMYQRVIPLDPPSPYYQGQVVQLELRPTELGHLLSNMYLKVSLPIQTNGTAYSPEGGRALIKQVDLLVNETTIETLYDDWYIIKDQLFLDTDEQYAMKNALGTLSTPVVGGDYVIPLEFFFCRRHSHFNRARERLRKPYFPLCAMWNQRLYVRITFHPYTWWSNAASIVDFTSPKLITEEILLDNAEKMYYQNTPLKYIVNRVQRESGLTFSATNPILQLTANFPVQMITWFFRNQQYENITNGNYSDVRYTYGYTTKYIASGINLSFPSGTTRYVDVIQTAKITLNNVDILSTFQGSLYYSFKQPMEHNISIPSKNIYTYSFGLHPKEYNQGGYLNFAKLNSQTTSLSLTFYPSYASQIAQGYNLYLFYYGYTLLQFQGGFASLPYL